MLEPIPEPILKLTPEPIPVLNLELESVPESESAPGSESTWEVQVVPVAQTAGLF